MQSCASLLSIVDKWGFKEEEEETEDKPKCEMCSNVQILGVS